MTNSGAAEVGDEDAGGGRTLKRARSEAKKDHDRKTIGTGYF